MIRHGETDWNKKRKLQGQVDIPLNEFGKLLAKETAPALADVPFAVCYTSPLKRAAETARLVLGLSLIHIWSCNWRFHFLLGCKKSTDGKLQTRRPAKWME